MDCCSLKLCVNNFEFVNITFEEEKINLKMCTYYDYEMALKHVSPTTNHLTQAFKKLGSKVKECFSKLEPFRFFVLFLTIR